MNSHATAAAAFIAAAKRKNELAVPGAGANQGSVTCATKYGKMLALKAEPRLPLLLKTGCSKPL